MHITIIATQTDADEVHCKFVGAEIDPKRSNLNRPCFTLAGYRDFMRALDSAQPCFTYSLIEKDFNQWTKEDTK